MNDNLSVGYFLFNVQIAKFGRRHPDDYPQSFIFLCCVGWETMRGSLWIMTAPMLMDTSGNLVWLARQKKKTCLEDGM